MIKIKILVQKVFNYYFNKTLNNIWIKWEYIPSYKGMDLTSSASQSAYMNRIQFAAPIINKYT